MDLMANSESTSRERDRIATKLRSLVAELQELDKITADPSNQQDIRAAAGGLALLDRMSLSAKLTLDAAGRALHVAERPFGLAIVGPLNSGKSTLVASLFPGINQLLPIRSQDSTGVVTRVSSRSRSPNGPSTARVQLLTREFFETCQWAELPQGFFEHRAVSSSEQSPDDYLLVADEDVPVLSDKSWPTTAEGWCRPQDTCGDKIAPDVDSACWGYHVSDDGRRLERIEISSEVAAKEALPLYFLMAWIREIQVFWDHKWLDDVDVLDMPGLGAIKSARSEERGELYRQFDPIFTQKNAALFREYAEEEQIDGLVVVRAGDPAATIPPDFQDIFYGWNESDRSRLVFLVVHKADLLFRSIASDALLDTMLWTNTVEKLFAMGRRFPDAVFITMSHEQAKVLHSTEDPASRWRDEFERGGRSGVEKVKRVLPNDHERHEIMESFFQDGGTSRMRQRVGDILRERAEKIRMAHLQTTLETLSREAVDLLQLTNTDVAPSAVASLEAIDDSNWEAIAKWRPNAQLEFDEGISRLEKWEDRVLEVIGENWVRCAKSLANGRIPLAESAKSAATGGSRWIKREVSSSAASESGNGEAEKIAEMLVRKLVSTFEEHHWSVVKDELRSGRVTSEKVVAELISRMLHGILGMYWRERVFQLESLNHADLGESVRAARIAGVKDCYLHLQSGKVDRLPEDLMAALSLLGRSLRKLGVGEGSDA